MTLSVAFHTEFSCMCVYVCDLGVKVSTGLSFLSNFLKMSALCIRVFRVCAGIAQHSNVFPYHIHSFSTSPEPGKSYVQYIELSIIQGLK